MRPSDFLRNCSRLWLNLAAGCVACGGSGLSAQATGGSSPGSIGGGSQVATTSGGSSGGATGGSSSSGGASTGGVTNSGGTTSAGGSSAAGGTFTGGGGSTGGVTTAGGTSSSNTGGALPTGGSKNAGGTSSATGGTTSTGGSNATGGNTPTGGTATTGGSKAASTGGTLNTGGSNTSTGGGSAAGARGAGICTAGSYSAPDLSGTAAVVTSSTTGGQYEGTLWLDSKGALLFSGMDTSVSGTTIVPATVGQLTPPSTANASVVANSGTNGLAIDFKGTVLGCSQGNSQMAQGIVTVNLSAGTVSPLVSTDASGHHFNSPNDLTVRTDGTIYFTDPDYQIAGRTNETGIKGVYRVLPSNVVTVVDSQFNEPNGISLSPDETTLYVADTAANLIRKFTVAADGSASGKTNFASMTSPDGGTIDCAGNVYWASNNAPGKVYVFSPSGTQLGTISIGTSDKPTNVAFGGTDHKTLYVSTSPRKIYSVPMTVPGFPY
jgi:gluconolactonase